MFGITNPFSPLKLLNRKQWQFFLVAYLGWTWDSFDFFTVSLTVTNFASSFNKSNTEITWGITLVLMFRPIGGALFGILADRYGCRWPYSVNLLLLIVFELATGFVQTYEQFLGVRGLYGVAMGGIYGMAAATALEDCPTAARGIISGLLQQGYAFGYLLATAFARVLVDTTSYGWRPLYWFGACPPVLIIALRLALPETDAFLARQRRRTTEEGAEKAFLSEANLALRKHWLVLIYCVLLMIGFTFLSHSSQDMYPTMLKNQYGFNANEVTVTQVVANTGAIIGGTLGGHVSTFIGRRLTIVVMCLVAGALIYPYTFVPNTKIIAPAFFEQFSVQAAWGVIPIHLMELSPDGFRTFVVGTAYQLGNLAASATSTIEAALAERFPLQPHIDPETGRVTERFEYSKVICIFMGAVLLYLIILTAIGPEYRGKNLNPSDERPSSRASLLASPTSDERPPEAEDFESVPYGAHSEQRNA